ncbi:MAG: hypothetical protein M3539_11030 [Acidobacteriota bacterium]|nr:hypothetical protein [Acidobacteriota bacterium]
MRLPILIFHICGGVVGVLSGAAAMSFRKGTRRHRVAGNVFFVAMLVMGSSAAYLGNVVGGLLACYLVATAWLTARRREGETSIFDWAAFMFALAVGILIMTHVVRLVTGAVAPTPGVPIGMIFLLGFVALLAAAGDLRMLVRGGVFGRQRIVRHLWRMCFSFFIATGSFFLGQQQVFPKAWRGAAVWFVPALLPLAVMIFWLIRVRFTNAFRGRLVSSSGKVQSLPT